MDNYDDHKLLVKLRRCGVSWRMDATDFSKFMNYVKHYFREYEYLEETMYDNLLYAEISEDGLDVISAFYGTFFPDANTLLLAEVYPGSLNLPRENPFILRLYVKTERKHSFFVPVKMIFK